MLTRRWLRPCRINWRNCGISAMAYTNEPVLQLAKTLVQSTFADKVFSLQLSGAEANEAALKLARK